MKEIIGRIVSNTYGLFKALRHVKVFPKEVFEGESVAIIGAASTALKVERKDYIESFNYVLRINRAIVVWKEEQDKYIGKRTDVLIHNFFENDDTGGAGSIDIKLFEQFGLELLIQPRLDYIGTRSIINFYKKYKTDYTVYTLSPLAYRRLKNRFGKYHPTRGFYSLYIVLTSSCASVFITGFTFFLTPYQGGYRSGQSDMESINAHITAQGYHSPDLELELFLELIKSSPVKKIILDEFLYDLVSTRLPTLANKVYPVE